MAATTSNQALAPLCVPTGFIAPATLVRSIVDADVGATVALQVTLQTAPNISYRFGPARMEVSAFDGYYQFPMLRLGNTGAWKDVAAGETLYVRGKIKARYGNLYLESVEIVSAAEMKQLTPKYRGDKKGELLRTIREAMANPMPAAQHVLSHFPGRTEDQVLAAANVPFFGMVDLLNALHAPQNGVDAEDAMRAARQLEALALVERMRQSSKRRAVAGASVTVTWATMETLAARYPKRLTVEQLQALKDVCGDLGKGAPMNRLLSGEVGSGKSLPIAISAVAARLAGASVAILVPNALLVEEMASLIEAHWGDLVRVERVTSDAGECDPDRSVLIGTTALFSRCKGKAIHYLVIDEQQRHGLHQKAVLIAGHTNVLEATATCIPRSAGLMLYGAQDVSEMRSGPVARRITSELVTRSDRQRVFRQLQAAVATGGQIAIVFPRIRESVGSEGGVPSGKPRDLERAVSHWQKAFPGQVAVLTGLMSDAEKQQALDGMKAGLYRVLVATSIIEMGVTIPSLKALMVIEPDRFGVGQLHQLRGRVGRIDGQGSFYMYVPEALSTYDADTVARLELVRTCSSGFELAEEDMLRRGFGSFVDTDGLQDGAAKGVLFSGIRLMPQDVFSIQHDFLEGEL